VYSYDPASNPATVNYPNGLQSMFTYDDLNRVTALNAPRVSYSYTLNPTGTRATASESNGRALNWSYDGIYRLTQETISLDPHGKNGTDSFGLDPVGNRLSQTASIPGLTNGSFTYDTDDRLSTETYDNSGNALTSGGRTFAYDFANRLKSMNNGAVTIVYDGDGNRVAKTAGGVTTHYLVDDLNPTGYAQVVDEVVGTVVSRTYTYGTQRIGQNQSINGVWTPSFFGYDGGGTVRYLANPVGTVTDTYDYDAWGNEVNSTGSTPNVYLYRGEQWDPDLGLYYLRARYFNPLAGRFLARDTYEGDPTSPSSFHKYLYADDNPVDRRDSSGRATTIEYADLLQLVRGIAATGFLIQSLKHDFEWPAPQACPDNIGNCLPFRNQNRQPGDKFITYKTTNPVLACGARGNWIFAAGLGFRPISVNKEHTGLLRGSSVIDNIYPTGVPVGFWEDGAYEVLLACSSQGRGSETVGTFTDAVNQGIGEITTEQPK
jgi:RHS repeat-associated protein